MRGDLPKQEMTAPDPEMDKPGEVPKLHCMNFKRGTALVHRKMGWPVRSRTALETSMLG